MAIMFQTEYKKGTVLVTKNGSPYDIFCDYSSAKYLMVRTIWLV